MMDLLEDLGLTAYEAKALGHLILQGETTAPDLSHSTGIPFGRVYDTLNALVAKSLVDVAAGRPKKYSAVPVDTIPRRLLAAERIRLQGQDELAAAKADQLVQQMASVAPAHGMSRESYGITLGEDSARRFLIEATHSARETVIAYLAFDELHDDDLALFEAFRTAVGRGLHTKVLLRAKDVDYLLTTPYVDDVLDAMLPHLGETLQVRLTEEQAVPFAALDGERAMLGVKNPLAPAAYFAVIHVEDKAFAEGLGSKFESMWQEAKEPRDMVQWVLKRPGGKAVAKLGAKLRGGRRT
jgi:sugar-specific transcriptional regulator TrmB